MFNRIIKNTLLLATSQMMARGVGFLYAIILARNFGVESFGVYVFVLAYMYNFVPVADFGIEKLVLRDISRKQEDANLYFSKIFSLRVFLWLITMVIAVLLAILTQKKAQEILYFLIFGFGILPYSLSYLIVAFRNAEEKMESNSLINIGITSFTALIGISFVLLHLPLNWIFSAYLFGNLFVFSILLLRLPSWKLTIKFDMDIKFWIKVLKESWVFASLLIISVIYLRVSVILLNYLKGDYLTGLYGSAFKFIEAGILIPQSLALALFPLSAKLLIKDKYKLKMVYLKTLFILFLLSLPFVVIFSMLPNLILKIAYGQEYLEATSAMIILGLTFAFLFLNVLPGNIIQNSSKVKQFLPFSILNLIISAIFCLILIPKYSLLGAAIAVLGGEFFGFIINNLFVFYLLKNE